MSTFLGPLLNKLPCHTGTSWRPKAKGTTGQGNTCGLSTSTSPALHRPCHYPASQIHLSSTSPSLISKTAHSTPYPTPRSICKSPTTLPILQSHTLPKPLRLMQPHLSKTFFDTCPPQTHSQVLVSHLRNPEYPQHSHQHWPPPVTLEEVVAGSPLMQCDSITEFDSDPNSPDSTCSAASTTSYTLWPRFPIMYNETALSCLHGRPQLRMCNYLSIVLQLSSNDEETGSEADAPAKVQILHAYRMNHWQADPWSDSPWWPGVESPTKPTMPDSPWQPWVKSPSGMLTQGPLCPRAPLPKHKAGVTNMPHQWSPYIPLTRPARQQPREH